MSIERDQASVRSISAMASSTRSVGVGALSSPTKTCTGCALAGSPMTVGIDRSSGTLPPGRAGGSTTTSGRTKVTACRRPSRPRESHGTRLAGSPLTMGCVQTPGAARIHGSTSELPTSIFCIARLHRALTPRPATVAKAAWEASRHTRPEPASGRARSTHLLGGPSLGPSRAPEHGEHGRPCCQPGHRRHVVARSCGRASSPVVVGSGTHPGALDDGRGQQADRDREGQRGEAPSAPIARSSERAPAVAPEQHGAAQRRGPEPPRRLPRRAARRGGDTRDGRGMP